jgi:hypothetical protein
MLWCVRAVRAVRCALSAALGRVLDNMHFLKMAVFIIGINMIGVRAVMRDLLRARSARGRVPL